MKQKREKQVSNQEMVKYSSSLHPKIKKIVANLGFDLLEVLFTRENHTNYLRITISHPDHLVTLNDCELASKEIEKELDKEDPIPFSYLLELQSPGINKRTVDNNSIEYSFKLENLGLVIKS